MPYEHTFSHTHQHGIRAINRCSVRHGSNVDNIAYVNYNSIGWNCEETSIDR